MKTDTHADADQAERIVAAMSDNDKLPIIALIAAAGRCAARGGGRLGGMVAFKDRTISEVRGRLAASRARLCGEPKRTRERKKAARRAMGKLVSGTEVSNREHRVDRNGKEWRAIKGRFGRWLPGLGSNQRHFD